MRVAAQLLIPLAALALAGAPAAEARPRLTVVAPAKVAVHPEDGGKPATAVITVLNDGPAIAVAPTLSFVGDARVKVAPATAKGIPADSAARVKVTIVPAAGTKKADGQLVVAAPGVAPGTVALSVSPAPTVPSWVVLLIFIPLGVAFVVVLVAYVGTGEKGDFSDKLGPVDWDFSKSWASNLTVFSALLGTILAAGVLPDETSPARVATYAALNLLFGLGVLVGPFLYTAFQTTVEVNKRGTVKEPQYQGRVWAFLLASMLTIWAAAGQFGTIWKLFDEIRTGGSLPEAGLVAFQVLVVVAAASLVVLAWTRLRAILRSQSPAATTQRRQAQHARLALTGVEIAEEDVQPELEPWPAL